MPPKKGGFGAFDFRTMERTPLKISDFAPMGTLAMVMLTTNSVVTSTPMSITMSSPKERTSNGPNFGAACPSLTSVKWKDPLSSPGNALLIDGSMESRTSSWTYLSILGHITRMMLLSHWASAVPIFSTASAQSSLSCCGGFFLAAGVAFFVHCAAISPKPVPQPRQTVGKQHSMAALSAPRGLRWAWPPTNRVDLKRAST
mmetsp:Transcript_16789/g.36849  ORF Transcript_16789/g.36849 Transcript_16789/m.36849 type:complete len:201 (+) Transcript_16789:1344-1946(+)